MELVKKITMIIMVVNSMPESKEFYAGKLGLKVTKEFRQDDDHWWVSVTPPEGGFTIALSSLKGSFKPGMVQLYFATSDIISANKDLMGKGVKVNEIQDNLYGPGSGVKFFNLEDPDGNQLIFFQE